MKRLFSSSIKLDGSLLSGYPGYRKHELYIPLNESDFLLCIRQEVRFNYVKIQHILSLSSSVIHTYTCNLLKLRKLPGKLNTLKRQICCLCQLKQQLREKLCYECIFLQCSTLLHSLKFVCQKADIVSFTTQSLTFLLAVLLKRERVLNLK